MHNWLLQPNYTAAVFISAIQNFMYMHQRSQLFCSPMARYSIVTEIWAVCRVLTRPFPKGAVPFNLPFGVSNVLFGVSNFLGGSLMCRLGLPNMCLTAAWTTEGKIVWTVNSEGHTKLISCFWSDKLLINDEATRAFFFLESEKESAVHTAKWITEGEVWAQDLSTKVVCKLGLGQLCQ